MNPLQHFVQSGLNEGRAPIPALAGENQILIAQTIFGEGGGLGIGELIVGGVIAGGGLIFNAARNVWEFVTDDVTSFTITPDNGSITSGTPPFDLSDDEGIQIEVFPNGVDARELLDGSIFTNPDQSELEFSGVVTTPQQTESLDGLLNNGVFTFPGAENPQGTFFLAIETNEVLRDLIDSSTLAPETKGKSTIYDTNGGFERANNIFDTLNLSDVKPLTDSKGDSMRTGVLVDGNGNSRRVNVRANSTDGRPTLEVIRPNGRRVKYRFNE